MSKIMLKKTVEFEALRLAISSDKKYLAIASEQSVRILSLPDFILLKDIHVAHTSSLTFTNYGSISLLITTTSGRIFLYNKAIVEDLGTWPKSFWRENPLFCCGDNHVVLAYDEGICLFDIQTRQFKNIYSCTNKELRIAACQNGRLYLITYNCGRKLQKVERLVIDVYGHTYERVFTDRKINTTDISHPMLLTRNRIGIFITQGQSTAFQGAGVFCVIDSLGHIIESKVVPKGYFICGCSIGASSSRYIALPHETSPHAVTLYDQENQFYVNLISEAELRRDGGINPPASVLFLSDEELLVGTWRRLYLYQIFSAQEEL